MTDPSTPSILALTDRWIVVAKPAGWLTIPPTGNQSGPPTNILSDWIREKYAPVWIVHRLDRDTTGIVLFARTAADHTLVNTWFQSRRAKKVYHCLAAGIPSMPVLKLQDSIRGSPSLTQVEILETYQEGFFAKVLIKTGRRHQIRIHLAGSGHPIWGDSQYGGASQIQWSKGERLEVPRVALHASHLELPTGESFAAPLPPDLSHWLAELRRNGTRV